MRMHPPSGTTWHGIDGCTTLKGSSKCRKQLRGTCAAGSSCRPSSRAALLATSPAARAAPLPCGVCFAGGAFSTASMMCTTPCKQPRLTPSHPTLVQTPSSAVSMHDHQGFACDVRMHACRAGSMAGRGYLAGVDAVQNARGLRFGAAGQAPHRGARIAAAGARPERHAVPLAQRGRQLRSLRRGLHLLHDPAAPAPQCKRVSPGKASPCGLLKTCYSQGEQGEGCNVC